MDVNLTIPQELRLYIEEQIQSGAYPSIGDYFLALVQQDRSRKQAQEKLENLLQEGLASDREPVTSEYWQNLRKSVLDADNLKA